MTKISTYYAAYNIVQQSNDQDIIIIIIIIIALQYRKQEGYSGKKTW